MCKVTAYACDECSTLMLENDQDLRTIYGNIYVGIDYGLIGDDPENMKNAQGNIQEKHYCQTCLINIIRN